MNYVGIDLGTTNSAICSYDGESVRLYKSPEQNDVTPSALFYDRRSKYIGARAYNNAARNPDGAATLFKRFMGSSTPITVPAVNMTLTPEECSAEILRTLFGYLPEDIRNSSDTGTVITVPAAFNQMQKDATMSAAESAGLGLVALMQEPVAAVMSVMRRRTGDGVFVIYDLGGGTLDVAVAEAVSGRVSLLAHGGIEMCGGRDFDRAIFENLVRPWLAANFSLPPDFADTAQYKKLTHMATWAAERAKIELSSAPQAAISLSEGELAIRDLAGADIYLDVSIDRPLLDSLIAARIADSIMAVRSTLTKAGLTSNHVERLVFIGGPTQYKPLRDRVASELGLAPSTDVNPMTAVAEGAAVFAESIDWGSQSRGRKSSRGTLHTGGLLEIAFNYVSRTPDHKAKIVVRVEGTVLDGAEFQIDSLDTGWTSGRMPLRDRAAVELTLSKPAENTFKVFVFDAHGGPVNLNHNRIVISRTAASVDAIPASRSIGLEAKDKIGGSAILDFLVREGESLPKKGRKVYKAEESLKARSPGALRFKLWEGETSDPIRDNRPIGCFKISGSDFDEGVIAAGAELICDYEIRDSGNVVIEVSVPSIAGTFHSGHNFYSRQEGQIDYSNAAKLILEQSERTLARIEEMESTVDDARLQQARERIERIAPAGPLHDPEAAKQAMDDVQEAKRLLALTRKDHLRAIRQVELDKTVKYFDQVVRELARPSEASTFDSLVRTAQRAIEGNSPDFESHLSDLRNRNFMILWRQDGFVIERFKWLASAPHLFQDTHEHQLLVNAGSEALRANEMDKLRAVVAQLDEIRFTSTTDDEMLSSANIVRG